MAEDFGPAFAGPEDSGLNPDLPQGNAQTRSAASDHVTTAVDASLLLDMYRTMVTAREIDNLEQELTSRGEAFFQLSGSGHEASVAFAPLLQPQDWLHCHYRDKALLLARGVEVKTFFDSLYCNSDSPSSGRRMSAFLADRDLNILSMVTPTGNSALQAVGVADAVKSHDGNPIVYCGFGDGTTQQGEVLEAIAEASREQLPVLFCIQDNGLAISTPTKGKKFYDYNSDQFHGVPVHVVDGTDVAAVYAAATKVIARIRKTRQPACLVMKVQRLTSHTNADDHTIYRSTEDIQQMYRTGDPLLVAEQRLRDLGVMQAEIELIQSEVKIAIATADDESAAVGDPVAELEASKPLPIELKHPAREVRDAGEDKTVTMRDAMRLVLREQLSADDNVLLFGEDIEDPKGDVFGVTKGLSTEFPGRVNNSPLSESIIVGKAVGQAMAGKKPVAFIQFADFLPLAYNQIASELATIYWRTAGQFEAPVTLMVACGGYRPGLGPYHAQTMDSLMAHLPGVDVFTPATATDAAGLLNASFQSNRPTVFLYPKALLNDPATATGENVQDLLVPIGVARKSRVGRDITFVGWGNTVGVCERAADALEKAGVASEVIDLRSLSPWDEHTVLSSAEHTARLVVVHEDNHTCGLGSEILATVAEKTRVPVAMRRVTRPDTHIPCNFPNSLDVLPSLTQVVGAASELLGLEVTWQAPRKQEDNVYHLEAIGSGPADETVQIVEWLVAEGDEIQRGDNVASVEATKSVFEITSPVAGKVDALLASEGDTCDVGAAIARIKTAGEAQRRKAITQDDPGTPSFVRKPSSRTIHLPKRSDKPRQFEVGFSKVATVSGSKLITNHDLVRRAGEHVDRFMSPDEIVQRTGIESRYWVNENENAVNLAAKACWELFDQEQLLVDDLDLVICSTTSPTVVTPSMACQVLSGIMDGKGEAMMQAYDINAACSGYLYALQAGYDYLQSRPDGRVLLVTTEVLSPLLDPQDFDTAILFGDAASATILYGEDHMATAHGRLRRPDLAAKSEDGSTLSVPLLNDGFIQMKGRKVFSEAVRSMINSLNRVCQRDELQVDDLDLIVPHQANGRIIDAIQNRVEPQVYNNIRTHGNTSSTSIPLCLSELMTKTESGQRLGLCAFGGGFTFGAGILEIN